INLTACFAPRPDDGMALIPSRNSSFLMGSDNPPTQENERPAHRVHFTYDFFISSHEVTQGEYASVIGRIPSTGAGAMDVGDSFPVYSVTWYDAALYCNAISKRYGYDTVYTYSSRCTAPDCPWVLENLEIRYDRFGFRLPTEAEWEYACRAATQSDYYWGNAPAADTLATVHAWYYVNATNGAQRVGRLQPNAFGLYDMAGNVAEWVNDWLDYYADSTVTNPVGPNALFQEQYESSGERPVRGGSWRLGTSFLRSSCRSGPYRTSAFTAQKDIGFRVALGAFNAGSTKKRPVVADSLPIIMACDRSDLFSFIGTSHVIFGLVVKQDSRRRLVMIDPRLPGSFIRLCGNDSVVFAPSISPDGQCIAYGSQGEGFSGPGTMTVRQLDTLGSNPRTTPGYLPRFWASPETGDTFIVFTDGATPNNLPRWRTENTSRMLFKNGSLAGVPEILYAGGSFHGGMSSDGRFLGTSYPVARMVDLQLNDTNIFLFFSPHNGRDDYPQVCNLSMSPSLSEPGEALLIDFGYPRVSTLVGKPYGIHAFIFICNLRSPEVAQWFEKPVGYTQWDFPEWSNHSGFMVSIARTAAGDEDALYIIRRSDSTYLKVATGKNLSYPALWIDPSAVSEEDDPYRWFGAYDLPLQWNGHILQAMKLRLFWHYRLSVEWVGVGSSPLHFGLFPAAMSVPTVNIAGLGSDMFTDVVIARDYLLPHAPRLKTIILELTPGFLNRNRLQPPRLNGLYDSKGFELDTRNDFYRNGLPPQVVNRSASFGPKDWPWVDSTGYDRSDITGIGWSQPVIDHGDYAMGDAMVQASLAELSDLADGAAAKKVHLLIVNFPENPEYKNTPMIGRYGPSHETYRQLTGWIDSLCGSNRFVHFYDANDNGNHDYANDEALDCNHLNSKGAQKLSARIDSLITTFK
ncbi:MAG: SUMF1/EgtB/PvdO family nonheme iron enzyme, partial [Chitinispirillaceae bacterium]|nr:SUMF1/EgtB/PvdO family nonheme iron enzyme [Chitinispirillaceae bacterium]